MGAQRRLKGSRRHPSRPQGLPQVPRDGQVETKGIPKGATGSPRSFQRKPQAPKDTQGKPAGPYIFANSRSTAPAAVMLRCAGNLLRRGGEGGGGATLRHIERQTIRRALKSSGHSLGHYDWPAGCWLLDGWLADCLAGWHIHPCIQLGTNTKT